MKKTYSIVVSLGTKRANSSIEDIITGSGLDLADAKAGSNNTWKWNKLSMQQYLDANTVVFERMFRLVKGL